MHIVLSAVPIFISSPSPRLPTASSNGDVSVGSGGRVRETREEMLARVSQEEAAMRRHLPQLSSAASGSFTGLRYTAGAAAGPASPSDMVPRVI